jgi:hypothetical protein
MSPDTRGNREARTGWFGWFIGSASKSDLSRSRHSSRDRTWSFEPWRQSRSRKQLSSLGKGRAAISMRARCAAAGWSRTNKLSISGGCHDPVATEFYQCVRMRAVPSDSSGALPRRTCLDPRVGPAFELDLCRPMRDSTRGGEYSRHGLSPHRRPPSPAGPRPH